MKLAARIQDFIIRGHTPLIVLLNFLLTAVSYALALGLRFDFTFDERFTLQFFFIPLCVLWAVRAAAYYYFKLHRGYWRYVSTTEAVDLLKAHAVSSVLFAAGVGLLQLEGFPRSLVFMEFTLSLLIAMGSRLGVRLCCEKYLSGQLAQRGETKDVVVIGAGASGHLLVRMLHGLPNARYRAMAIFDDTDQFTRTSIHGVPVVGTTSELGDFLERHTRIAAVILAVPTLSAAKQQEIQQVCERFHLPLKRLQSFEDIACYESAEPLQPLSVEQVLSREIEVEHEEEIRNAIAGKRVLITGAGGSIGSELVRQVVGFGPSQLILVEKCEYNLFAIQQELLADQSGVKKVFSLANICDAARLDTIFSEYRPQLVFHAAAYKHVPLLEANCYEAFVNNIIGTRTVFETAQRYSAERFVLISTDKAVDPSSVMGCTKRIAELMVALRDRGDKRNGSTGPKMSTAVVRFGNVINSAGSVIPVFKKQILSGGPITVTHPDMERYFMSIPEAVRLVLTAGTLGDCGEIYLLDMGKPIKIVEVAKKLLALYGRRDIPIVFTGLRPGEKLSETLFSLSELRMSSRFRKVFVVKSKSEQRGDVFEWIDAVSKQIPRLSELQIEAAIRGYVKAADQEARLPLVANGVQHDFVRSEESSESPDARRIVNA
ncbi:MAG: polysaccharide biosynthesis protein [Bdellovibrionales bacterium]|nr:polysaccharide biosynthesis protein [Bdellovibrionales bacterium]